jgi:hypothetical protein
MSAIVVHPSELSDAEAESYAQAVDIFEAAPTSPSIFNSAPVRDDAGKLREVRFYKDDVNRPLAVIEIADDGAVLPLRLLP